MLRVLTRIIKANSNSSTSTSNLQSWQILISLFQRRKGFCFRVLPDASDCTSEAFVQNSKAMEGYLSELQSHIDKVLTGGGPEAVKINNSKKKLLLRERIDSLVDSGSSFLKLSQVLVGFRSSSLVVWLWYATVAASGRAGGLRLHAVKTWGAAVSDFGLGFPLV